MTSIAALTGASNGMWGVKVASSPLMRFAPQPRSASGSWIQSATSAVSSTLAGIANVATGVDDSMNLTSLLNQQIAIQQEMQVISMASNIAKSKHEMEMAPIRNMRVG